MTAGTFNTGKNRVRGIEFGLAGNLTRDLQVQWRGLHEVQVC